MELLKNVRLTERKVFWGSIIHPFKNIRQCGICYKLSDKMTRIKTSSGIFDVYADTNLMNFGRNKLLIVNW